MNDAEQTLEEAPSDMSDFFCVALFVFSFITIYIIIDQKSIDKMKENRKTIKTLSPIAPFLLGPCLTNPALSLSF